MNEELLIKIKAQVDDATKKLEQINKKLGDIGKESKQASKDMTESFKQATRAAMLQVEAVKQLASSMINLGKSALEAQKEVSKLNTAFLAAGSTTKQAEKTYTDLFRFMGDAGAATEAAQSLAALTTNEKQLNEWTKILQGTYATFGSTLPVEGLAEAINHTAQLGTVQGNLADALEWIGINVDSFNASLANTVSLEEREALIRSTLNNHYLNAANIYEYNNQALLSYNEAQARLHSTLAQTSQYLLPLLTAVANLANVFLAELKPAIEIVSAVLVAFIQYIVAAIKWIGSLFSIFTGKGSKAAETTSTISSGISAAGSSAKVATGGVGGLNKALDKAAESAKELKRQTMGFDELNIVRDETAATTSTPSVDTGGVGGGGGGGGISIPSIGDIGNFEVPGLDDFQKKVDAIKERIESIIPLVLAVGAGLLTWKVLDLLTDPAFSLSKTLTDIASKVLIVGGAILTVKGYSDGWVNGVGWSELLTTLGGMAAVIAGIQIAYGSLAASIATVTAGLSLMVLGVKDFIDNGPTLQNTILIIGGAIAVAVGLATAGLSVLVSVIIAAVAAVAAFTAAILLEKPAIMSVEEAQNAYAEAKQRMAEAENGYINAVDRAESALERLQNAEKEAGTTGEELYKLVQQGALDYADMTDAQREVYKAYLENEAAQEELKKATEELNAARKAEVLAAKEVELALAKESGSYDDFKKSVIAAYEEGALSAEEARDLMEKAMSEMSDDAQQTFMEDIPTDIKEGLDPHKYEATRTKIKKWFQNLWEDIKNIFKVVGDWFKDIFTKAWDGIKNAWSSVKDWFKDIWDKIKETFKDVGTWFKEKFTDAWTKIKDVFSNWGEFFGGLWDKIKEKFTDLGSKLAESIGSSVKSGLNSVITLIENTINKAIGLINSAIDLANLLPGVNVGHVKTISLPRLAKGGIVDSATIAMIGEQGKEAVLPLENNTQWMDKLAEKIASINGGGSTRVVLKVGERELGYATIDAINGITKQTGGLKLQLV